MLFSADTLRPLMNRAKMLAAALAPEDPMSALDAGPGAILEPALWEKVRPIVAQLQPGTPSLTSVDEIVFELGDGVRREAGIYPTPWPIALKMGQCIAVDPLVGGTVVDLSAGTGALLRAAIETHPTTTAVGVEVDPLLAVAAAIGIWEVRCAMGHRDLLQDRVFCGDGLRDPTHWADLCLPPVRAVLGNPPYLGEKGRKELFDDLRQRHGHLAGYFAARMDLLYLFFHRGLDILEAGGQLVYLTSEYYLMATGARTLRRDLSARSAPRRFIRFEQAGLFRDAPGHHSLITVLEKKPASVRVSPQCRAVTVSSVDAIASHREGAGQGSEVSPMAFEESRWVPFIEGATMAWHQERLAHCSPLSDFASDHQGFVSGADRLSPRHLRSLRERGEDRVEEGAPIFLAHGDAIPETLASLSGYTMRPVLRGSMLEGNRIYFEAPRELFVLYIDQPVSEAHARDLEKHLGPYRSILEERREVIRGNMPWYRLHWPRRRRDQTGPKLVIPRRAESPCFALDLSGAAISSDCTYLVALPGTSEPVRYLTALMLLLNSEATRTYLEAYGKRKGALLEFYSDPLRKIPIPARRVEGSFELIDGLWSRREKLEFWDEVDRRMMQDFDESGR